MFAHFETLLNHANLRSNKPLHFACELFLTLTQYDWSYHPKQATNFEFQISE